MHQWILHNVFLKRYRQRWTSRHDGDTTARQNTYRVFIHGSVLLVSSSFYEERGEHGCESSATQLEIPWRSLSKWKCQSQKLFWGEKTPDLHISHCHILIWKLSQKSWNGERTESNLQTTLFLQHHRPDLKKSSLNFCDCYLNIKHLNNKKIKPTVNHKMISFGQRHTKHDKSTLQKRRVLKKHFECPPTLLSLTWMAEHKSWNN